MYIFYFILTSRGESYSLRVQTHFRVHPCSQPLFAGKSSDFSRKCSVLSLSGQSHELAWYNKGDGRTQSIGQKLSKFVDIIVSEENHLCTTWTELKGAMVGCQGSGWMKFLMLEATGSRAPGRAPSCGWSGEHKAERVGERGCKAWGEFPCHEIKHSENWRADCLWPWGSRVLPFLIAGDRHTDALLYLDCCVFFSRCAVG